jgi:hypothetical protein
MKPQTQKPRPRRGVALRDPEQVRVIRQLDKKLAGDSVPVK